MKIKIITYFEKNYNNLFISTIGQTIKKNNIQIQIIELKKISDKFKNKIDLQLIGGGKGMLMTPTIVENALKECEYNSKLDLIIIPSPRGQRLSMRVIKQLIKFNSLIFISPRYEGIDSRVSEFYKTYEFSVGNFVLFDGDIPILMLINALIRYKYYNKEAVLHDSFYKQNILECDNFTKPKIWNGLKVPDILFSGNHKLINEWKQKNSDSQNIKRKKLNLLIQKRKPKRFKT